MPNIWMCFPSFHTQPSGAGKLMTFAHQVCTWYCVVGLFLTLFKVKLPSQTKFVLQSAGSFDSPPLYAAWTEAFRLCFCRWKRVRYSYLFYFLSLSPHPPCTVLLRASFLINWWHPQLHVNAASECSLCRSTIDTEAALGRQSTTWGTLWNLWLVSEASVGPVAHSCLHAGTSAAVILHFWDGSSTKDNQIADILSAGPAKQAQPSGSSGQLDWP